MSDRRFPDGNEFPTESLSDSGQDAFDQLAEEFANRCRNGELPSIAEYVARFPGHAERIHRLLPAVMLMEQLRCGTKGASGAEPARPMPGKLGEFRVIRELGRGGMGVVYEAEQESLGRHVAVKIIHDVHLNAKRLQRFQREAQAVARLHHTNIVPIFAVGEHDGLPYFAMQYISGSGLDAVVKRWRAEGPPQGAERWRMAARIGVQVADALQYAHEQGVLHRDIKPANLLIDDQQCVWVTDFGLAKLADHEGLSTSGDVIGTLQYMPPECLRGVADPRSDLCSLGLTLYELLTLSRPFGDLSPSELLRQVSERQPAAPRRLDASIPRDLETVILKAIAREPGHRYATAAALADDLRRFLEDRPVHARRVTAFEATWRWSRRNPTIAVLAAAVAGSLLLAGVIGWVGYANTTHALRRSDENVALSLAVFEELFDRLSAHDVHLPPPPGREVGERSLPGGPGPPPRFGGPDGPPDRFGGGPPPPDHDRGGFGPRPNSSEADPALLQTILKFYDRFAAQNATNPRLQGEAAWAYRKVGALYNRLGREADAEAAYAKAIAMFEELVARYPDEPGYRYRLVQTYDMSDPWLTAPAALERVAQRLERARMIIDRLAAEAPENPKYARTQIWITMKLGPVLARLRRTKAAEACYHRVIDLVGTQLEGAHHREDRLLDRATVREALALLELDRGRKDEARSLLDEATADLEETTKGVHVPPPVSTRFATLAEAYRKLGDNAQAEELARRATELRGRGPEGPPGRRQDPGSPRLFEGGVRG